MPFGYCDYCGYPLKPASAHASCFEEAREKFLQDEEDERVNVELLLERPMDEICPYCGDPITPKNSHFRCFDPMWEEQWKELVEADILLEEEIAKLFNESD